MRAIESGGNLQRVSDRHIRCKSASGDEFVQRSSAHVLHHHEVDAVLRTNVMKDSDVGMLQPRNRFRLLHETGTQIKVGRQMRWKNFYRNPALQPCVPGAINLAHASLAEKRFDLIRPELRSRFQRHWRWGIIPSEPDGSWKWTPLIR